MCIRDSTRTRSVDISPAPVGLDAINRLADLPIKAKRNAQQSSALVKFIEAIVGGKVSDGMTGRTRAPSPVCADIDTVPLSKLRRCCRQHWSFVSLVEAVVDAQADDADIALGDRNRGGRRVARVIQPHHKIFGFDRPIWREQRLDTTADGKPRLPAIAGDPLLTRFDMSPRKAAGQIGHENTPAIANAPAQRAERVHCRITAVDAA